MSRLTFAMTSDGLLLPALIGLDAGAIQDLLAQGKPIPKLFQARAQIDTGSVMTGVGPRVLAVLGAVPAGSARTQTASGLALVQFFRISFTIYDPTGARGETLARTSWLVTNLPQDLPDVDVLFGMDLVRELVSTLDGPSGHFSLDY